MAREFYDLPTFGNELESDPRYQAMVDTLMDHVLALNPPCLFLAGNSAELLGVDLLQRAQHRDQPFPIKLYTYPVSSAEAAQADYIHYLQLQVQQVATKRVYFLEDFVQGGGKIRMISNGLSKVGLESRFFVLTSLLSDGNTFGKAKVDILFPGNSDLTIRLGIRSYVNRRWTETTPILPDFPAALN